MEEKAKFRRRKFWVDTSIQLKFVGYNVLFLSAFALIVGVSIYFGIWRSITKEFSEIRLHQDLQSVTRAREYENVRERKPADTIPFLKEEAKMLSQHQQDILSKIISNTNSRLVSIIIILMFFVILSGVILSHRVAGPAYRLKQSLKSVLDGDLTARFKLRDKDELKDLAACMAQVISGFTATIEGVRKSLAKIKEYNAVPEKERGKFMEQINEIERSLDKYKTQN